MFYSGTADERAQECKSLKNNGFISRMPRNRHCERFGTKPKEKHVTKVVWGTTYVEAIQSKREVRCYREAH
jgi:hypothetical protein